jgi:hypothetical protein
MCRGRWGVPSPHWSGPGDVPLLAKGNFSQFLATLVSGSFLENSSPFFRKSVGSYESTVEVVWIIGKEANSIDDEPLDGGIVQVFRNVEKERVKIIEMRQCDAEKMGVNRGTRWRLRQN